ncbi:MAG: hypothetical protein KDK65_07560, partial [Chlamydiia bacterium]|nr:hypothetical protein [Chlamydiia bacterium]
MTANPVFYSTAFSHLRAPLYPKLDMALSDVDLRIQRLFPDQSVLLNDCVELEKLKEDFLKAEEFERIKYIFESIPINIISFYFPGGLSQSFFIILNGM